MKLLLDTHIFLWFISGDKRLSQKQIEAIQNAENEIYLSVVSIWEAIIKHQLGKLPLPHPPEIYLPQQREGHRILSLPLDEKSAARLALLPPIHRDPFDRILVCQAQMLGLTLVTADPVLMSYAVSTL